MIRFFLKSLLPLVILLAGAGAGAWFFMNPDEAKKRPQPEAQGLLVEVSKPEYGTYSASVEAMGQVLPAVEVALKAQVGGEILVVEDEFIPGGFFREGDIILDIDPADYELAAQKAAAALRQAQAAYDLEMGRQSVARDELRILERTTGRKPESPELALRKPQLEQAQAELEIARSDLEVAQLALRRTTVNAPFNALVTAREAVRGDKVAAGQALATLAGTDEYWIEVSVPVTNLRWLDIPQRAGETGSAARIVLDGGRGERRGDLLRQTGTLDTQSRLAALLVRVRDPLAFKDSTEGPPLVLGDYALAELTGRPLKNKVRVPLSWVRDGNIVWIKEDGRLVYRSVQVIYEDREYAYIGEGITRDDKVVVSDITVPVEGMKIRTVDEIRKEAVRDNGR